MGRLMVSILVAQANLAFQAAVFAILAGGLLFTRIRKTKTHAQIMLAAAVLNIVSAVAVMAPALPTIIASGASFLAMLHGSVGGLTLLLSVWVLGAWLTTPLTNVPTRFRCYGTLNKKIMSIVSVTWLISLLLGVILYAALYLKVAL